MVWWHDSEHLFISFAGFLFGMGLAWLIYLLKRSDLSAYSFPSTKKDWLWFLFLLFIGGSTMSALFCGISVMIGRNAMLQDTKPWR